MSLEEHLKIGQEKRWGRLPNPTLRQLLREYSRVAVVYADPSKAKKQRSDLKKVLALRPSIQTSTIKATTHEPIVRKGYFAYGKMIGDQAQFNVFAPSGSPNSGFPIVNVTNAVSRLVSGLSLGGYNSINIYYLKP